MCSSYALNAQLFSCRFRRRLVIINIHKFMLRVDIRDYKSYGKCKKKIGCSALYSTNICINKSASGNHCIYKLHEKNLSSKLTIEINLNKRCCFKLSMNQNLCKLFTAHRLSNHLSVEKINHFTEGIIILPRISVYSFKIVFRNGDDGK